jgi:predicted dithiol-disulfide oxidoreductase (DUF899 family)
VVVGGSGVEDAIAWLSLTQDTSNKRRLQDMTGHNTGTREEHLAARLELFFAGCSQLLVYHFMFGPKWTEGCPVCSYWADSFDRGIVHLNQRDVTMLSASRAPLAQLDAHKRRMGWTFPWVSSGRSDFNYDFGVSLRDLDAGASQREMERPTGIAEQVRGVYFAPMPAAQSPAGRKTRP